MATPTGLFAERRGADPLTRYTATVHLTMAAGLLLSAIAAVAVTTSPALYLALFTQGGLTAAGWIVTLAPLALVLLFAHAVDAMSIAAARLLFVAFAILTGASLASLFAVYTAASIAGTFFAAAAGYGALALAGFVTARDLSRWGKFLTVALVGLLAALVANLFVRSAGFDLLLACAGVAIFGALVAIDSQRVRTIFEQDRSGTAPDRLAIVGALTLYLDLLNLFLSLIRLTGRRR